jgi:hypothetical protein
MRSWAPRRGLNESENQPAEHAKRCTETEVPRVVRNSQRPCRWPGLAAIASIQRVSSVTSARCHSRRADRWINAAPTTGESGATAMPATMLRRPRRSPGPVERHARSNVFLHRGAVRGGRGSVGLLMYVSMPRLRVDPAWFDELAGDVVDERLREPRSTTGCGGRRRARAGLSRVIPDAWDGLTVVERRVLFRLSALWSARRSSTTRRSTRRL